MIMIHKTSRRWIVLQLTPMLFALSVQSVSVLAADIPVPNGSFEDVNTLPVGGVWPEADVDPLNADFWLEPGPVSDDLNAFPPALIPPGFAPPNGATLDTGVFFNSPMSPDSFLTNADGNQLAYLFAKDDLQPPIGFIQHLTEVYELSFEYTLTVAAGKSFFLPPIGGDVGDPTMALRLLYEDDLQQAHIVAQVEVAASAVQSTLLTDFSAMTSLIDLTDPWQARPIIIEIAPADGSSGSWVFDNVRLSAVPEPATIVPIGLIVLLQWRRRNRRSAPCRATTVAVRGKQDAIG